MMINPLHYRYSSPFESRMNAMNSSDATSRRIRYRWVVLTVSTLVVFGALGLARFGYGLVLPEMQRALRLDNAEAGGIATANVIGYLLLSLVGGALASRFGARLVISLGMLFVGGGMLATATSNSVWSAILWRTLTGLGSGASNVPSMALLTAWFGPGLRGLATGIGVAGSSIAIILIGPLVPRILTAFPENGWRVTWYIFGGAALLLALMGALMIRNEPSVMRLHRLGNGGKEDTSGASTPNRLKWYLVYRSPRVWNLGMVYAAFGFSYIIYMTFFFRYLTGELNYLPGTAGNLFMLMGWFSLGCGLLWGVLSDRIGRKGALILVYITQATAIGLMAVWPRPAGITLSAILFGLTAWSIPAIMAATCGDILGHRLAPAALGFITLFFGIGQATGPIVAGMIADVSGSFTVSFLIAAGVELLGGIGAVFLQSVKYHIHESTDMDF